MRGRGDKEQRADADRDIRQFFGGSARVVEIIRGQQDLDGRDSSWRGCWPCVSRRTPRMDAAAASIWPCARRSSASPG